MLHQTKSGPIHLLTQQDFRPPGLQAEGWLPTPHCELSALSQASSPAVGISVILAPMPWEGSRIFGLPNRGPQLLLQWAVFALELALHMAMADDVSEEECSFSKN